MLHKLPVVSQTSTVAASSHKKTAEKDPPRQATVLIVPPGVGGDTPDIANDVNRASVQTQRENVISARAGPKSQTSSANSKHVLANSELMDLHRNGILPGRWQILTRSRSNSQNRNRRKK